MLTKTKLALAATLLVGSVSFAAAEGYDPNLANRYPTYNGAVAAPTAAQVTPRGFQSAPVALRHRNSAQASQTQNGTQENWQATDSADRASSPYSGF